MNDISFFIILTTFLLAYSLLNNKSDDDTKTRVTGFCISIIITLALSYCMSLIYDQNSIFEIFIIVQIISFLQAVIGNWLGKFFN